MTTVFEDGCYACTTGAGLIAKVLAGHGRMTYTRAAIGSGHLSADENPRTMTEVPGYVMDGKIAGISNPTDGECSVTVQVLSEDVDASFVATGILLYALDPDTGEDVPYTYLYIENCPDTIRGRGSAVVTLSTFNLIAVVGEVDNVTAIIDRDTIMTRKDVEELIATTSKRVVHFLTLKPDEWVPNHDMPYIDVPVTVSRDTSIPHVEILPESMHIAAECGLSNIADARNRYIRFTADTIPKAPITAFALLIDTTGAALPGDPGMLPGTSAFIPTATTDTLGGVKIGYGIDVSADGTISLDQSEIIDSITASDADADKVIGDALNGID